MKSRDNVYYSFLSSSDRYLFERVTENPNDPHFEYDLKATFDEDIIESEYYHSQNNRKFLDKLSTLPALDHLSPFLGEQLKMFARRKPNIEGYEKDKNDFQGTYTARENWLKHTRFICQHEYIKTENHIYAEAVLWCDEWIQKYLPLFDPYSPEEKKRKYTFKPLWQELKESTNQSTSEQDVRYYLDATFSKLYDSQYITDQIKESGYFPVNYHGNYAEVYLGWLAAFFINQQLEVKNLDTNTGEIVDGTKYLDSYVKEFRKGIEYFESSYKVNPSILFGSEAKEFGESLQYQYYHSKDELGGWTYWKNYTPPVIVTYKIVKEYGYYAGIFNGFMQMANKYPSFFNKYVFRDFEQDQELINNQTTSDISTNTDGKFLLSNEFNSIPLISDAKKQQYVKLILAPLSALNPQKKLIMNSKDYARLVDYVVHLVITDSLPSEIIPIKQTGISNEHIRYTFYRLHKELFGTRRIKQHFIEFLHQVFSQFKGTTPETTKRKFSTAPRSYETDFAGYIGEVE